MSPGPDSKEGIGRRIVLAGGGTGGHIEPMLAVADALRVADPDGQLTCLGTARGLEVRLVPSRGYELELIPPVPLPRKLTLDLLRVPGRLRSSVLAAGKILHRSQAQVLVGFGGYVALPAYLAARRAGIPIVVHEQNALPGLANRIGARLAAVVAVTFPGTPLPRAQVVGMPLRAEVATLDRCALRLQAREYFGLESDRRTLLVFGGSQGARSLNSAVSGAASALTAKGIQILHAVGPKNLTSLAPSPSAGQPRYIVVPYIERMELAYAAADLALCRAGAVTCAELSAVGLPGVFVPLPIGNGEQRRNAEPVVAAGGGFVVPDASLSRDYVVNIVGGLLADDAKLTAMARATARFGRRDAAAQLAGLIMGVAS